MFRAILLAFLLAASTGFAQDKIANVTLYRTTAAPTVAEIATIETVADVAGALGGKYFDISTAGDLILYRVWIDVDNGSTAPAAAGRTLISVEIAEDATDAAVATAIVATLDPLPGFAAAAVDELVTVTYSAKGAATNVAAGTSGFTVGVSTEGVSSTAAIAPASIAGKLIGWKICNDAVNTSTHLYVGKAMDTETDGVMLGKDQCFACTQCKSSHLQEMKVSAQDGSNGYSVLQFSK
jgi:hypothetical protein